MKRAEIYYVAAFFCMGIGILGTSSHWGAEGLLISAGGLVLGTVLLAVGLWIRSATLAAEKERKAAQLQKMQQQIQSALNTLDETLNQKINAFSEGVEQVSQAVQSSEKMIQQHAKSNCEHMERMEEELQKKIEAAAVNLLDILNADIKELVEKDPNLEQIPELTNLVTDVRDTLEDEFYTKKDWRKRFVAEEELDQQRTEELTDRLTAVEEKLEQSGTELRKELERYRKVTDRDAELIERIMDGTYGEQ